MTPGPLSRPPFTLRLSKGALRSVAILLLAGCGPAPTPPACTATFSGNFSDASSGRCPTAGADFTFEAEAPSVSARLTGSITLGSGVVPGTFTSQTVTGPWSAVLTREPGCVISAGRDVVPAGSFVLVLDAISPAHGTLTLTLSVHALPGAHCGPGDLETVHLAF